MNLTQLQAIIGQPGSLRRAELGSLVYGYHATPRNLVKSIVLRNSVNHIRVENSIVIDNIDSSTTPPPLAFYDDKRSGLLINFDFAESDEFIVLRKIDKELSQTTRSRNIQNNPDWDPNNPTQPQKHYDHNRSNFAQIIMLDAITSLTVSDTWNDLSAAP